nr:50S ribosomal protein L25 [Actinomycetota bacterium]
MDEIVLTAETGRSTGTRPSRRSRTAGKIPAVLYGLQQEPVTVSVDWPELRRAITTEAGLNAIIHLEVGGERHMSIVKEIQRHPVRRDVLHVDFVRIDPDQDVTVDVSIVMVGEAKEVTDNDGMVDQNLFTLSINAAPDNIPTEIEVDISALTIGDSVRVGDLVLPDRVTTDVDPDEAVAVGMITRSTLEAMAVEEAAEEAALAAEFGVEGEDGESAAGADEASDEDSGDTDSE